VIHSILKTIEQFYNLSYMGHILIVLCWLWQHGNHLGQATRLHQMSSSMSTWLNLDQHLTIQYQVLYPTLVHPALLLSFLIQIVSYLVIRKMTRDLA